MLRRTQSEERIRELWLGLPENQRAGLLDVHLFKNELLRSYPHLLGSYEGDLLEYLKTVLDGLYSKNK